MSDYQTKGEREHDEASLGQHRVSPLIPQARRTEGDGAAPQRGRRAEVEDMNKDQGGSYTCDMS